MCLKSCTFVIHLAHDCFAWMCHCHPKTTIFPINELEARVHRVAQGQIVPMEGGSTFTNQHQVHWADLEIYPGIILPQQRLSPLPHVSPPPGAVEFLN